MCFTVNREIMRIIKKILTVVIALPFYLINKLIDFLSVFSLNFKKISCDYQWNYLESLTKKIKHTAINKKNIDLEFYTPNSLCMYRAESFSNKEPETLEWIEEFGKDKGILFDIGANIGLYSIYHAKLNNGKCVAFEPSCFNLKLLTKNININNCQELISVISNPLSDNNGFSQFRYGSNIEGGALSAFGVDFDHNGECFNTETNSNILGFTLDWMLDNSLIEVPTIVKVDVDGIEHMILKGARNVLSHTDCKSILIEVNDDFGEQSKNVQALLTEYGYSLRDKLHGDSTENSELFSSFYNQIWVRK